jgi:hypothetical protein
MVKETSPKLVMLAANAGLNPLVLSALGVLPPPEKLDDMGMAARKINLHRRPNPSKSRAVSPE